MHGLLFQLFFMNLYNRVSFKLLSPKLQARKKMYLIVIAWLYVTLLMALAEAFSTQGSVLGAIITFVFYGLLPMALVVYLMGTPLRRKAIRKSEQLAREERAASDSTSGSVVQPDAGSHSPSRAKSTAVPAVGKEDLRL